MCSLEEAFSSFTDTSRNEDQGSLFKLDAEKKHRKKRRATLPPPEPQVIEPDRPAHRPLPPGELLGGAPTSNTKNGSESEMLNAFESADYFPHPSKDVVDKNVYNLEPDWATAFNDTSVPDWIKNRMPHRENEAPLIPSPPSPIGLRIVCHTVKTKHHLSRHPGLTDSRHYGKRLIKIKQIR